MPVTANTKGSYVVCDFFFSPSDPRGNGSI